VPLHLAGAEREVGHQRRFLAQARVDRAVQIPEGIREGRS
jgi:hypothetical protein